MIIDIHSHILPNIDHGSNSIECSIKQLHRASAVGIDTIVATPHFFKESDTVPVFIDTREGAYIELSKENSGSIKIIKAAEVTIQPGLEDLVGLDRLCIGDTRYILLEMPTGLWNEWVFKTIYSIEIDRNLIPVIAHIDRYNARAVDRLIDMNLVTQVNAEALLPFSNRKRFIKLFSNRRAFVLGSDAHGQAEEFKAFSRALKILGKDLTQVIMTNAECIIGDKDIQESDI